MTAGLVPRQPDFLIRGFSIPKWSDTPIEDRWLVSDAGPIVAVSDGASVSFDSGMWAEIITRRFIADQDVGNDWLDAAVAEYQACHDRETMDWMKQGAFDRGSFATLLGVVASFDEVRACVIGDSLLALVDGEEVVSTFPYENAAEFDQSPRLLSTNAIENKSVKERELPNAWHDFSLAALASPKLLLMTDAIGRWLLDQPNPDRVRMLLDIQDAEQFGIFVEHEHAGGRLKRDDYTLVVLGAA